MTTATITQLSHRDHSLLRAVAAGRCELSGSILIVDGLCCCDQFAGVRLAGAGLIARSVDGRPGRAQLTPSGQAMLDAA